MKKIVFALLHKSSQKLLSLDVSDNGEDAEFCNQTTCKLEVQKESVSSFWFASSAMEASLIQCAPKDWFNSTEARPSHSFAPSELEVVEVVMEITPAKVTLPSFEEYLDSQINSTTGTELRLVTQSKNQYLRDVKKMSNDQLFSKYFKNNIGYQSYVEKVLKN